MATRKQLFANGNVIKYILFPALVLCFIGIFIIPEVRLALALYVGMGLWSLNAYRNKAYQEEVYGIGKKVFVYYVIGGTIGVVFLVLQAIVPSFALLTPTLSLSVSEDIRWAIIVLLAPLLEEVWRSATIGYIREIYKPKKFWKVNLSQAVIFGLLHTLVYGLAFGAYSRWADVFGTFNAISGSILAAVSFGLISGYLMNKFKDIVPSIAAHQVINFWIVSQGLIVVS